jgi:hypothetical protein
MGNKLTEGLNLRPSGLTPTNRRDDPFARHHFSPYYLSFTPQQLAHQSVHSNHPRFARQVWVTIQVDDDAALDRPLEQAECLRAIERWLVSRSTICAVCHSVLGAAVRTESQPAKRIASAF